MSPLIAQQGSDAYGFRMASMLLRLLTLIAVILMPMGMANASVPAQPAAGASSGHCDEHQKPVEAPTKSALHCAACAALPTMDVPLAVAPLLPQPPMSVAAVRWITEAGPETETPPPKRG